LLTANKLNLQVLKKQKKVNQSTAREASSRIRADFAAVYGISFGQVVDSSQAEPVLAIENRSDADAWTIQKQAARILFPSTIDHRFDHVLVWSYSSFNV
jgi:hypothetical protein